MSIHLYELTLSPTAPQAAALLRLASVQHRLAWVAGQDWTLADLTATAPPDTEFRWAVEQGLPHATVKHVVTQARAAAVEGRIELLATMPPQQLKLAGPGVVQPLSPGWLTVPGVPGPVAAATDDCTQLPRWAREVIGREYRPAQPETLVQQVPALRQARRKDWADIRWEWGRWVLELEFEWHAFQSWDLSWCAVQEQPRNALLRQLMG